jgi:hypothetical protein
VLPPYWQRQDIGHSESTAATGSMLSSITALYEVDADGSARGRASRQIATSAAGRQGTISERTYTIKTVKDGAHCQPVAERQKRVRSPGGRDKEGERPKQEGRRMQTRSVSRLERTKDTTKDVKHMRTRLCTDGHGIE